MRINGPSESVRGVFKTPVTLALSRRYTPLLVLFPRLPLLLEPEERLAAIDLAIRYPLCNFRALVLRRKSA